MCGHESFIILGSRIEIFILFSSHRREKGNSVYPSLNNYLWKLEVLIRNKDWHPGPHLDFC